MSGIRVCSCVVVACLAFLSGCGDSDTETGGAGAAAPAVDLASLKTLNVSVMGLTTPEAVKFAGHCVYTVGGKEMKDGRLRN